MGFLKSSQEGKTIYVISKVNNNHLLTVQTYALGFNNPEWNMDILTLYR